MMPDELLNSATL